MSLSTALGSTVGGGSREQQLVSRSVSVVQADLSGNVRRCRGIPSTLTSYSTLKESTLTSHRHKSAWFYYKSTITDFTKDLCAVCEIGLLWWKVKHIACLTFNPPDTYWPHTTAGALEGVGFTENRGLQTARNRECIISALTQCLPWLQMQWLCMSHQILLTHLMNEFHTDKQNSSWETRAITQNTCTHTQRH